MEIFRIIISCNEGMKGRLSSWMTLSYQYQTLEWCKVNIFMNSIALIETYTGVTQCSLFSWKTLRYLNHILVWPKVCNFMNNPLIPILILKKTLDLKITWLLLKITPTACPYFPTHSYPPPLFPQLTHYFPVHSYAFCEYTKWNTFLCYVKYMNLIGTSFFFKSYWIQNIVFWIQ